MGLALAFFALGYLHEGVTGKVDFAYFHNLPNFLSVITCSALMGAFYKRHDTKNVIGVTFGLVVYELMQLDMAGRTFDLLDIVASCLGMCLYLTVYHTWQYAAPNHWRRSKTKNPA